MVLFKNKRNKNYIDLSKAIYDSKRIEMAITAFSEIGEFIVEDMKSHYRVYLVRAVYDKRTTLMEFENYLIDLMN